MSRRAIAGASEQPGHDGETLVVGSTTTAMIRTVRVPVSLVR